MKKYIAAILLVLLVFVMGCNEVKKANNEEKNIIQIEYPEAYELSNIILALTDYGLTDKWQVRKDFPYYDEMLTYFEEFKNHPLLDSVNFSKERWKEYLSFRTDAYAFKFNEDNKLERQNDFYAFDIKTFDKHLDLVQDFADKSDFRSFYKKHKLYYENIKANYQKLYMLEEMKAFLTNEFGEFFFNKEYKIIISPFVYAQNLHRNIDSITTADFPSLSKSIILGKDMMNDFEKSKELHTIFTEMDHGYVNPTSENYTDLIDANFDDNIWSKNSGYENKNNAVFNEYMTWAVYDLFNEKYFPNISEEVNMYWHFQNETRGFQYSYKFSNHISELYSLKKNNEKIADLYPKILAWTKERQSKLSKSIIVEPKESLKLEFKNNSRIKIKFSEPLSKMDKFSVILQDETNWKDTLNVDFKNKILIAEGGKELSFDLNLPKNKEIIYVLFNWWGTKHPIKDKNNSLIKASSYIKIENINQ